VAGLVSLLFAGLLQLGLALHVRNTLIDSVSEGARFGALADRSPADGAARARSLISGSLPDSYADDVTAVYRSTDGLETVEVTARVPVPVVALLGADATMTVRGHGAVEVLP
jgi:hypothetical protein